MAFELLTVAVVGFSAAGVVLFLTRVLRIGLPRWVLPAATAAAMIGYAVWLRYTWAERVIADFPADWTVVERYPYQGTLEPWTALFPRTDSLLVLDRSQTMENPEHPRIHLVTLLLLEQHADTLFRRQFVDCVHGRQAPAVFGGRQAGLPPETAWIAGRTPAALFAAVCEVPR